MLIAFSGTQNDDSEVVLKVKKLTENAIVPASATEGDFGLDLTCTSIVYDVRGFYEMGTGIAIELPKGYAGIVLPRSSISAKNLVLANSVGLIDAGYTGEIKFRFYKIDTSSNQEIYKVGERIGQLVLVPIPTVRVEEVSELRSTTRGSGGYGSTGA